MLKPSCGLATRLVYKFLAYNKEDSSFPAVFWSLHCPSESSRAKLYVTKQKFIFQNFSNKFWLSQKWDGEVFYVVSQFYFYPSEKRALDVDVDNTALWCFIFLSSFVVSSSSVSSFSFLYYLFIFTNTAFILFHSFCFPLYFCFIPYLFID